MALWVLHVALMFLWLVCFVFLGKLLQTFLHSGLNVLVNIWPKYT